MELTSIIPNLEYSWTDSSRQHIHRLSVVECRDVRFRTWGYAMMNVLRIQVGCWRGAVQECYWFQKAYVGNDSTPVYLSFENLVTLEGLCVDVTDRWLKRDMDCVGGWWRTQNLTGHLDFQWTAMYSVIAQNVPRSSHFITDRLCVL
jgi:hypothetical protein